jgi:serine/threonine-protein kinase RsbT
MEGASLSTPDRRHRFRDSTDVSGIADHARGAKPGMAEAAFGNRMDLSVPVSSGNDVVEARREGRTMAARLGLSATEATLVATAISELARNIVDYAGHGEIHLSPVIHKGRRGITIVARDQGPGIADIKSPGRLGPAASGGLGLSGVRRIMDEFDIASGAGRGTTVTVTKWKRQ